MSPRVGVAARRGGLDVGQRPLRRLRRRRVARVGADPQPREPHEHGPQPLPAPLNRRNLRFGYKEDVFCPEGCKPKED